MATIPKIESGKVAVARDAPWMAEFRREMTLFPNGKHDDQVDSLSQFLNWWDQSYQGPLKGSYGAYK